MRIPSLLPSIVVSGILLIAAPWMDPIRSFGLTDVGLGCLDVFGIDLALLLATRPIHFPAGHPESGFRPLTVKAAAGKAFLSALAFTLLWLPSTRMAGLSALCLALLASIWPAARRSMVFSD